MAITQLAPTATPSKAYTIAAKTASPVSFGGARNIQSLTIEQLDNLTITQVCTLLVVPRVWFFSPANRTY